MIFMMLLQQEATIRIRHQKLELQLPITYIILETIIQIIMTAMKVAICLELSLKICMLIVLDFKHQLFHIF